jgi:hypothetical protein
LALAPEIEEEISLIDKDFLSRTLEDRYRPATRRDRRLEILVDERLDRFTLAGSNTAIASLLWCYRLQALRV